VRFAEANRAQRAVRRLAGSGPGSWLFARLAQRVDEPAGAALLAATLALAPRGDAATRRGPRC
jgi:hypothetical protein